MNHTEPTAITDAAMHPSNALISTFGRTGRIENVAVLAPVVVEVVAAGENSVRISCITLGETTVILSGGTQGPSSPVVTATTLPAPPPCDTPGSCPLP